MLNFTLQCRLFLREGAKNASKVSHLPLKRYLHSAKVIHKEQKMLDRRQIWCQYKICEVHNGANDAKKTSDSQPESNLLGANRM